MVEEYSFKNVFRKEILQNKYLIFFSIFVTILAFGFTITNFSIGVDDPARVHYLYSSNSGNMIQQGRLLHIIWNKITGTVDFIPFFNDFLAASFFCVSALLFCAFIQMISKSHFSTFALVSFSSVYISFPIINEKFIYQLDVVVVMISYCAAALSLIYSYQWISKKNFVDLILAIVFLMIAISSYESFVFYYFCGVFLVFITQIITTTEKFTLRKYFENGIKYAMILISSLILYYAIVFVLQYLTNQYGIFERYNIWEDTAIRMDFYRNLYNIIKDCLYNIFKNPYLSCRIFSISFVLGFILIVYLSYIRKSLLLFLSYACLFIGNIGIHIIMGGFTYRIAQTFCLFVAFVVLLLIDNISSLCKQIGKFLPMVVMLLVIVQSAEMNRWFYNDYIRYQKEVVVIDKIATDLITSFDISKPVLFIGKSNLNYLSENQYPYGQVNGAASLPWSIGTFGDDTSPFIIELFHMRGYSFIKSPNKEDVINGYSQAISQPFWPEEGYIQELDNMIIVKLGEISEQ